MMCLWCDSLMWGERSLGRGLCIDLYHSENARGTFGGAVPRKNDLPASLVSATVFAVSERSFKGDSKPSPNSCLPESGKSSFPKDARTYQNLFSAFRRDLG